jgi:hypothetical protein
MTRYLQVFAMFFISFCFSRPFGCRPPAATGSLNGRKLDRRPTCPAHGLFSSLSLSPPPLPRPLLTTSRNWIDGFGLVRCRPPRSQASLALRVRPVGPVTRQGVCCLWGGGGRSSAVEMDLSRRKGDRHAASTPD